MTKENFITPIIVAGLILAFSAISFIVWSTGGNKHLINSKLKIGAAILTLTAFINTNSFSQKTCYKPANLNEIINFSKMNNNNVIKIYSNEKYISGKIENLTSNKYFFTILDTNNQIVNKGEIEANDGKFNDNKEGFLIHIGKLAEGDYQLKIFNSEENLNNSKPKYSFKLIMAVTRKQQPEITCYY